MPDKAKNRLYRLLRWSERYTHTDMVYLARGGFWLGAAQVAAALIAFGLAVAFGHLASQDTYGNYKYILTIAGLLGALTLSGLPTAVTQAAARGLEGSLRQGARLMLRWSMLAVIVGLGTAAYYFFVDHNTFLLAALICMSLCTPLLNAYSLFDAFLIGRKDFRRDAVYGTFDLLLPTLAVIGALFLTHRAIVLIMVYFLANTTSAAVFYFLTLSHVANSTEEPGLLSYSGHLSVMNLIATIADRIDSILVFVMLGPVQLAVYTFAVAMPEQVKALIKNVVPLTMPRFSERSLVEIRLNIWPRVLLFAGIISLVMGTYALLTYWIFKFFFPVYLAAVPYSRWYALSIVLAAFITPFTSVFQAHRKTRQLYIASNVSAVVLIISLPILIPLYGIAGAIASQILFRLTNAGLMMYQFATLRGD